MAGIYRRKGRKCCVVDYVDAHGIRRRLMVKSREAAEALRDERSRESRQAAPPITDPHITFNAWADRWLAQLEGLVAPRTRQSYAETLDRYLPSAR